MPLSAALLTTTGQLAPHVEAWDELAVAAGRPYCSPFWMLAWWRNVAAKGSLLRVVVALENGRLLGVAPFVCEPLRLGRWRYRLLSSGTAALLEPLAVDARRTEVAFAFADALRDAHPRPSIVAFEGVPSGSPWRTSLVPGDRPGGAGAGRGGRLHHEYDVVVPSLWPRGDYDVWLASRSGGFRSQARRAARALQRAGGRLRFSESEHELTRDLASFERLHRARWADRGGSNALLPGVSRMLADAAPELLKRGRLRLAIVEVADTTIGAQLFVGAGRRLSWWLGGSDDAWSACRPALLGILHAVQDGIRDGVRVVELGPGDQLFKQRLANEVELAEWSLLAPRPSDYPLLRAYALPGATRRRLSGAIGPQTRVGRTLRAVDREIAGHRERSIATGP